MSRLKYDKIPIWENKRRIKELTFWRDLWLTFASNRPLVSPKTGQPFSFEERRGELNRRIPAVREMVTLAEVHAVRDWMTVGKQTKTLRVDILEQFWYVERLWLSFQAPSDVVDEAIGKYQSDQRRSWIRTFNPFYWISRLIDWLISEAFNVVKIFGGNPETARASQLGRVINAFGQFIAWIAGIVVAIVTVLWFLGFDKPIRNYLHLP
jgi:hypothetical protein